VRAKKVRRAAGVATMSGWTMALFAILTAAGGLLGDLVSLALGLGLGVVAYNELRGAAMLRRFEERAALRLGWNQVGLGVLLVVYAGWSLVNALIHPIIGSGAGATGDAQTDAMLGRLSDLIAVGMYGGIGVLGIIAPGLTACYYFTRGRVVRKVVEGTPGWVIQAMRAAA